MDLNEAKKKRVELTAAIDAVLSTDPGRKLFALLFKLSAYNRVVSAIDNRNSEILPASSAYNDGRRSLYVDLRQLASYDLLKPAEELAERPEPIKEK